LIYRATYLQKHKSLKEVTFEARNLRDAVRVIAANEPPPPEADSIMVEPLEEAAYNC
jgi:hypothetical protein